MREMNNDKEGTRKEQKSGRKRKLLCKFSSAVINFHRKIQENILSIIGCYKNRESSWKLKKVDEMKNSIEGVNKINEKCQRVDSKKEVENRKANDVWEFDL